MAACSMPPATMNQTAVPVSQSRTLLGKVFGGDTAAGLFVATFGAAGLFAPFFGVLFGAAFFFAGFVGACLRFLGFLGATVRAVAFAGVFAFFFFAAMLMLPAEVRASRMFKAAPGSPRSR